MKATMTDKGLLSVRPETGIEVYALKKWAEKWLLEPAGFDKTERKKDLVMVSSKGLVVELSLEDGGS